MFIKCLASPFFLNVVHNSNIKNFFKYIIKNTKL
jgi:hypothetical protein